HRAREFDQIFFRHSVSYGCTLAGLTRPELTRHGVFAGRGSYSLAFAAQTVACTIPRPCQPLPDSLDSRCAGERETMKDALHELVAHLTIGLEAGLAGALHDAGIERVPELDIGSHGPGHLHGPMLGFRRKRHDEVERAILQIVEGLGFVLRDVDAEFVHH